MPNDNAMNKLLYAILSQKCLKDIDWNAVASNPILGDEKITNGHAARMRYSRFKKQMDNGGVMPVRKARSPNSNQHSPKRSRVEKNKSGSKRFKDRHESDDAEDMKTEDGTPELRPNSTGRVKNEFDGARSGSEFMTPGPITPRGFEREESPTPSPAQSFGTSLGIDDLMSSFAASEDPYGSYDAMSGSLGLSTGLSQDMGSVVLGHGGSNLYGELTSPWSSMGSGEGAMSGVCVKREERWEDGYRHGHAV